MNKNWQIQSPQRKPRNSLLKGRNDTEYPATLLHENISITLDFLLFSFYAAIKKQRQVLTYHRLNSFAQMPVFLCRWRI